MVVPHADYILDNKGQKVFVKLTVKDWESFVKAYQQMEALVLFKDNLKNAFREVRQIQNGIKKGVPFNEFLNDL